MALKIKWTEKADIRFEEIIQYLETKFGTPIAKKIAREIYFFIDLLSVFPEMGTIENRDHKIRGIVISKQITLFYQIRNDQIILLNFYDNRQFPKDKKFKNTIWIPDLVRDVSGRELVFTFTTAPRPKNNPCSTGNL